MVKPTGVYVDNDQGENEPGPEPEPIADPCAPLFQCSNPLCSEVIGHRVYWRGKSCLLIIDTCGGVHIQVEGPNWCPRCGWMTYFHRDRADKEKRAARMERMVKGERKSMREMY